MNQDQPSSVVLMYHRIGSPIVRSIVRGQYVTPTAFRWEMKNMLSLGYRPATLADMLSDPDKALGYFSVTFDDGYENVGRLAYPILREMNVPATVFVVSGSIGKTNEWDVKIGDRVERMLSLDQLKEMSASGVEIGSHTINHAHLTECSDDQMQAELRDSKHALEDTFGKPVVSFAYPYGEWNPRVREAVIESGYKYAVVTTRAAVGPSTDPLLVPRINMRWNTFGHQLRLKLNSAQERKMNEMKPLLPEDNRREKRRKARGS